MDHNIGGPIREKNLNLLSHQIFVRCAKHQAMCQRSMPRTETGKGDKVTQGLRWLEVIEILLGSTLEASHTKSRNFVRHSLGHSVFQ